MSITRASRRAEHVRYCGRAVSSTLKWISQANCAGQFHHRGSRGVRRWRDVDVPTRSLASRTNWNEAVAIRTPQGCFVSRQPLRCFGDLQRGSLPHLLLRMDRHVAIGSIDSLTSRGPVILPTGRLECESRMAACPEMRARSPTRIAYIRYHVVPLSYVIRNIVPLLPSLSCQTRYV